MAQKLAGHVIDEEGYEIEVWVEPGPDSEEPAHVYLMFGGSQVGDFPFNHPQQNDELQVAANRVAGGEAKILSVFTEDVIDWCDCPIKWH